MERFETRLEGGTLKLDFTTSPAMYAGKEGMPHASGGIYLDICGQFTLTAELDGMTLATLDNVTIKPYASFHTMWEISMMSCFGWRTRGTTTAPPPGPTWNTA